MVDLNIWLKWEFFECRVINVIFVMIRLNVKLNVEYLLGISFCKYFMLFFWEVENYIFSVIIFFIKCIKCIVFVVVILEMVFCVY